MNYEDSTIHSIDHDYLRDPNLEESLYERAIVPRPIDPSLLILLCSDSRVQPPVFAEGLPLAIQTLGAHIPRYNKDHGECVQLDSFFRDWFATCDPQQIIIIEHDGFVVEGPHCGAAKASLDASSISEQYLSEVINTIASDASQFEDTPTDDPEDRALAKTTEANIRSYPAVREARRAALVLMS